jgi:uncharacterized OsmC-like protein
VVQITTSPAGLFILVSLALGIEGSPLFVSSWALAFTAFVGASLFQFGFTKFCPLGIMLKKLGVPSNRPPPEVSEKTMSEETIRVELTQQQDYRFVTRFGGTVPDLVVDEPVPTGGGTGPSPKHLLAAAVGSCLADSLLFALRKFKQKPEPITCTVETGVGRNAQGRLRVQTMKAVLTLGVPASSLERLDRVLDQFEAFCTVSQSVGAGIAITVEVWDAAGARLK